MSTLEKTAGQMMPCVAAVFKKGAPDPEHFEKMRHAIIFELNRLGIERKEIKIALLKWNNKNYRVLSVGEAKRKLSDYVDWFFKLKDRKLSCKALEDYCINPNGGCAFKPAPHWGNLSLPFPLFETMAYLEKKYQPHGYLMGLLLKVLFAIQKEKNARNMIFVGVRELRAKLNDNERHNLDNMTILRALNRLEDVGLVKITRGKSGTFGTRHANGYTFLEWIPPMKKEEQPPMRTEEQTDEVRPTHESGSPPTHNNSYV